MSVRIPAGLLGGAKEHWCPLQLLAFHSRPLPLVNLTTLGLWVQAAVKDMFP
ncbi:hypothetical protein [Paenibacillus eucommiae]|uniref:Uncharacterized protein n=1 Tax=Paenibacillus eucommiae TaxID=1355755 RepID=A0ABS4JAT2_9BACL|nr:hypothetical protein [Paenibacillus eucommiae]MBP1996915.1 hypothetical protein [Paenibacillus eucommiae]